MEQFRIEIEEAVGGLSQEQKDALDEAHRVYHSRLNGALPFDTQIAIVLGVRKTPVKTPAKVPAVKKASQ